VGVKSVEDDLRVSTRADSHPPAPAPDGGPR